MQSIWVVDLQVTLYNEISVIRYLIFRQTSIIRTQVIWNVLIRQDICWIRGISPLAIRGIEQPAILQVDEEIRLRKYDGTYDLTSLQENALRVWG